MPKRNYYTILNVSSDASTHEIKRAYRQLALKYHPDKSTDNKASAAKFQEITETYEVLCDNTKRELYNQNQPSNLNQTVNYDVVYDNNGSEMVLIPAGEFIMGSNDGDTDEVPTHAVYIDDFLMDRHPVTNAEYKAFIDENPKWRKDRIPKNYHDGNYLKLWDDDSCFAMSKTNHPVVAVSWYAAMAYAQWAEKRLPTEAEWEKAARGGLIGKKYPWGNSINKYNANYGNNWDGRIATIRTTPVGSYTPNGYGLCDMVGNVREWCLDAYQSDFYENSPSRNPIAGDSIKRILSNYKSVKNSRVFRGGTWYYPSDYLRVSHRSRDIPIFAVTSIGFRCVKKD
ncbi:MAG: SUMF1/EgtB/PvdO family nonheme iron enzyme [Candidatus Poribacteria bacterium]|nr:SUMF1/EgtB/PvdO family nonheme iron enzyme [Candidatus Poribacteria bacterium]